MKILEAIWFTQMGESRPIGIVIGQDEINGERKAYIGMGYGNDESQDVDRIAATGAKIYLPTVNKLTRLLKDNH